MLTTMRCSGFPPENYGFYALGSLTGAEREEIEEHLNAGCETCLDSVQGYEQLWFSVGTAVPDRRPPRRLRSNILKAVRPAVPWWKKSLPAFAAVAALIALAVGCLLGYRWAPRQRIEFALAWPALPIVPSSIPSPAQPSSPSPAAPPGIIIEKPTEEMPIEKSPDHSQAQAIETLQADLARERQKSLELQAQLSGQHATTEPAGAESQLRQTLEVVKARADELERQVAQYRVLLNEQNRRLDQNAQLTAMLKDPSIRLVRMRGTERASAVQGHALIADSSRMIFYASGLPSLPADRTYQLWLMRSNGAPVVSAGLLRPGPDHGVTLLLNNPALLAGATALAVTDEPAQGSPLPTGHKWMIGS